MKRASSDTRAPLEFIESMECLAVTKLPDGPEWTYEIKLDGFRLEAVKTDGKVTLYSRRGNVLNQKFPYIAAALGGIPEGTIIDGELVALDEEGRSVFNLLQNYRSAESQIHFYAFDLLVHKGKDLTSLPLSERRKILEKMLRTDDHIGLSVVSNKADEMLAFVREHGLEGVVAKRRDSIYQPGCNHHRVLPWRRPHLRRASSCRFCPRIATRGFFSDQRLENYRMPIFESS